MIEFFQPLIKAGYDEALINRFSRECGHLNRDYPTDVDRGYVLADAVQVAAKRCGLRFKQKDRKYASRAYGRMAREFGMYVSPRHSLGGTLCVTVWANEDAFNEYQRAIRVARMRKQKCNPNDQIDDIITLELRSQK